MLARALQKLTPTVRHKPDVKYMTEEEKKKAAETAEAEEKEKKEKADAEFEESIADLSDEEKEAKRSEREAGENIDNQIDYKAQLAKEKEAREKAEKALADKRFKEADKKRRKKDAGEDIDDEDDEGEDDEDQPLTRRDISTIIQETAQQTEKRLLGPQIKKIAESLADSTDEAELIIEIHKGRIWPQHLSLDEQLEEAHAIANRKKLVSKNKELARSLQNKGRMSNDSSSAHRSGIESPAPKLDSKDESSYKRAGFEFSQKEKIWKKKLPNGKFLCKDPRSKKTWVS